MTRVLRFAGAAAAMALLLVLSACVSRTAPADVLIRNATVYTGDGRAPFIGSVAIRDGVFAAVLPGDIEVAAASVIDGRGKFLAPGLWDMHVHLRASENGGLEPGAFSASGVASVRDLGGYAARLVQVQREAREEQGLHIYSSYTTLNGKAFAAFQRAVTTEAEVAAAIGTLKAAGAAQIKIHRAFPPTLLPAAVRLAHENGLTLIGHIPLGLHPLQACEAGMDGIEHAGSFLEAYISVTPKATVEDAIAYMLSDAAEPLYRCLASRHVAVTPTLVVYPAVALQRGKGAMPDGAAAQIEGLKRIVLRLHKAGVMLLTGTDASDLGDLAIAPGTSLLDEMEMLQSAGIAPRDVLAMATGNAARALGLTPRAGTIEAGRNADFVLLSEDPGLDVRAFRKITASGRGWGRE